MLTRLRLFRSVGQFEHVDAGVHIPLQQTCLVYAENGRGKTTLASVLRSLATGDPLPITARRRLMAAHAPEVIIEHTGTPSPAVFSNNAWNGTPAGMIVFDDVFVNENIYSGLAVDSSHRQNLHELILGSQGVALNQALQNEVSAIEALNRDLSVKSDAIPPAMRFDLPLDDFCALQQVANVDAEIQTAERAYGAAQAQATIQSTPDFERLVLPPIDANALSLLLGTDLASLNTGAAAQVQAHFSQLGANGEAWVAEGMQMLPHTHDANTCPFCAQDLTPSVLISNYRAYFSNDYEELKRSVAEEKEAFELAHGGDVEAAFERRFRVASERRTFWSGFAEIPQIDIDTAAIADAWGTARQFVMAALNEKQRAPLDRIELSPDAITAIGQYEAHRLRLAALNTQLQAVNPLIAQVKLDAAAGNVAALEANVKRLKASKQRFDAAIKPLCSLYLAAKTDKGLAEGRRDAARAALDNYRTTVFPAYQTAVNDYLRRLGAGFRLDSVVSVNNRGGSSCTYNVLINNFTQAVPVTGGGNAAPDAPSFKTLLSAGDRNTLALAFFLASLDQDPNLGSKIVVIDDPITSLDDHRATMTVQEIRRLTGRTAQTIILSHDKRFLCSVWKELTTTARTALELVRVAGGSTMQVWNVSRDSLTEHDHRHEILRGHLVTPHANPREIAEGLRHVLEAYCRVAYPEHLAPGQQLGTLKTICEQRVGTPNEVMSQQDIDEFKDLTEYAHRFHHDTNPAYQTMQINDAELVAFTERTLRFTRR